MVIQMDLKIGRGTPRGNQNLQHAFKMPLHVRSEEICHEMTMEGRR